MMQKVVDRVNEILGDGYVVGIEKVAKANFGALPAVTIRKAGSNIAQCVYLYPEYGNGEIEKTAQMVVKQYLNNSRNISLDSTRILDKDYVLSNVHYQLVETEKNEQYLETVVHKEILDMSAIYRVNVGNCGYGEDAGTGTAVVTSAMMKTAGIGWEELDAAAMTNLAESGCVVGEINDYITSNLTGIAPERQDPARLRIGKNEMYYVTNRENLFGASLLLNSHLWNRLAENVGKDLYILPSSIHEVLVMADGGDFSVEDLADMVRNVNASDSISEKDILTDSVYHWSRAHKRIELAQA